ncbi:MAG TPA: EAL domain-containing protein [Micromonosporaceae bacterium]
MAAAVFGDSGREERPAGGSGHAGERDNGSAMAPVVRGQAGVGQPAETMAGLMTPGPPPGPASSRPRSAVGPEQAARNVVPEDRALPLLGYVAVVVAGAVAVFAVSLPSLPATISTASAAFWVIAALAIAVDTRPFMTPPGAATPAVFPSIAFTFALLLGWGLAPAVLVQTLAVAVVAVRLRHAWWRAAFNVGQYTLAFAAADLVYAGGQPELAPSAVFTVAGALVILAGGWVWFLVNQALVATAIWLRFGGEWFAISKATFRHEAWATLALLAIGPVVVAAGNVSAALIPLMLVPLYAVNQLGRATAEQQRKSLTDELTGLPNRIALFWELRAQASAYAQRAKRTVADRRCMALLMLDIDHFRRVNEALGHMVGDRLLCTVARRLRDCIGPDGFVARLGGDEFAVLAPRLADASAAGVLAERVADALAEPVGLDGLLLDVNAGIGVAVYPEHGRDHATLLRHAEVAMYDAKDRGAKYTVYSPGPDVSAAERLELLADLRRALELGRSDELCLHYQPQVDLDSGDVVGLEALLRWCHPVLGEVSPSLVIRVTEHTAVMRLLTRRVLEDAIGQIAKWRTQGLLMRVSVNVSVRDLHDPQLVDHLEALLTERSVPPQLLQLEITEGALMADPRRVLVSLHRLDRLGVAMSLDDFGTGYSSLLHLRRLPLAEVKIDRSFVLGMTTDPDDRAVVTSIIDLARALGLRVVAEGVEDDSTRRMLVAGGCEVAQGWFYARPMPPDDLVPWLARHRPPGQAVSPA